MKRLIIEELHDSQILHEVLEMVNTILTILASQKITDSASRNIGEYAEEILKRKVPTKVINNNFDSTCDYTYYFLFRLQPVLWETSFLSGKL